MRGASLAWAAGLLVLSAASTAAASGGGVSENQLWDFLYRIINFVVLAGILIFLLKKPFKSGLKGRSKAIADELKELEAKRDEARRAYAMMERRLADTEKEREEILARFKEEVVRIWKQHPFCLVCREERIRRCGPDFDVFDLDPDILSFDSETPRFAGPWPVGLDSKRHRFDDLDQIEGVYEFFVSVV